MAKGDKKSWRPKSRLSLAVCLTAVGGAIAVFGFGAAYVDKLIGYMNQGLKQLGVAMTVTGTTIVAAAWVLKGAAWMMPKWFAGYKRMLAAKGFEPAIIIFSVVLGGALFMFGQLWGAILPVLGFSFAGMPGSAMTLPTAPKASAIKIASGAGPVTQSAGVDWVDSVTRYGAIAAVNTWTALTYFNGGALGVVQVPSKAAFISQIEISSAFDVNSTAAVYKLLTAIRMSGSGFVSGGIYKFLGQCGTHVQVNAFSAMSHHKVTTYMTRIPVKPSDQITIEGAMLAEDCGDLTISVTLHFSSNDPGAGIVDSDCRNVNVSAVDTPTAMTTFAGDTFGNYKVPTNRNRIVGVVTGIAVDFSA